MEDQPDCIICFEGDAESWVSCQMCNTRLCHGCMSEYMNHTTLEMNKLPVCPQCKNEFLISSMDALEDVVPYSECLYIYLKRNPIFMSKVTNNRQMQRIIEKIREEKIEIIDRMPKCIALCIKVALKDKLKEVMKVNKEHVASVSHRRKCFSGVCPNGRLEVDMNGNFLCDSCGNTFCKSCEKIMFENHICNPDDLESQRYISALIHCPTCNIPVQKVDGCDHLTCSNCKTNFSNTDGTVGVYGGRRDDIKLKGDETYRLYKELEHKYSPEMIELIKNYELEIPGDVDYSVLEPFLEAEDLNEDDKINLFGHYSEVRESLNKRKQYFDTILDIRQLHIDDNLTDETLRKLLPRSNRFRSKP